MIQIKRPRQHSIEYMNTLISNLMRTEKYLAIKNNKLKNFKKDWKGFIK